ncbi:MAG: methyltransferase family protein [Candidatus Odinarchaeota archaeon]
MSTSEQSKEEYKVPVERVKMRVIGAIGLLLPFLASIPPITAWGALMTVPFLMYIILVMTNPTATVLYPADIINIVSFLLALLLLAYSVGYLWTKKLGGLVTTGPYRFVRHPQYFSIIIFTTIVTYQSVWILQNTFGIGWLSVEQTIALWVALLVAYVIIASIEELHLKEVYGSEWTDYRNRVGFLIPFVHYQSRIAEALICIIIPILVLLAMLWASPMAIPIVPL